MKKILLTGGSGFIGRNILESHLAEKYEITAPKSKKLNLADSDAVDGYFKDKKFDAVIHSACKPGHRNAKDLSGIYYANTRMFFNLAKNKDSFDKFINLGSGAVYDMEHYEPKMKEDYFGKHIPKDETGFSKYVINKYIEKTDDFTDLRAFGIYGMYEDYEIRFISNAVCKAVFGLPVTIKQNRMFDYLWIDDLYQVLEFFIENKAKSKAYNVTPDKSVSLFEIAEIIEGVTGKKSEINISKDGMGAEYSGDNSRLKAEFPGIAFTPLKKGIEKLYNYYNFNKPHLDRNKLLFDK